MIPTINKIIVTISILLVFSNIVLHGQTVENDGWLQVKGTQLCSEKGNPIVLRGMSFGWHNFHPRFYDKSVVQWLHDDWHCNIVRAAMGIELAGGYKEDSSFAIKKVEAVVQGAIENGMYVIIDWHSHNINLAEATAFFDKMSKKYAHTPNVLFEIFNEPDEESWSAVKSYAETILAIIRKNAPKNIVLVGCPHWDQDIQLPAADPIKGYDNIMYTVHYYAATHKQWLRDKVQEAISKSHIPVFISESAGMEASGDGQLDIAEWERWIQFSEKNKLSWITWSVSDKDESCSVLYPSASSKGKWTTKDLKLSGQKVREYLRHYNTVY